MKYNFDEIINRRNTNCVKWDRGQEDVLPMWVADMDFKAATPILKAIEKKVEFGVFGYTLLSEEYYQAIIDWWTRRHQWELKKEWLVFSPGVVPSLKNIIEAFTKPGDKVLIQSPVYYPFYRVIKSNECEVVTSPLKLVNNKYEMDFEDLEKKLTEQEIKLFILCSPHNPGGRVWTKDELVKVGELCLKHGVLVVADEIHCDLVYKGYKHTPFGSISEEFAQNSITCVAPSKTFNLAGLTTSNIIIPNKTLKATVENVFESNEVSDANIFGIEALIAAYNESEDWLEQLLKYLGENLEYLTKFFEENLPKLKVVKTEGTYLVWIDCRALGMNSEELTKFFLREAKVWFNDGKMFGADGEGFVRINVACPREYITEGLTRIKKVYDKI